MYWVGDNASNQQWWTRQPGESGGRQIETGGSGTRSDRMGQSVEPRLEGYAGNGNGSGEPGRVAPVAHGSATETGGAGAERCDVDWLVEPARQQAWLPGQSRIAGDTVSSMEHSNGTFIDGRDAPGWQQPLCDAGIACDPGAWSDFVAVPCLDSKSRRVESGLQPLAHGVPARMGRLRGYGNAIVPQVAAAFVRAYLETYLETKT